MKTVSEIVLDHNVWLEFLEYRISGNHLSIADENDLRKFVEEKEYVNVANDFISGKPFAVPTLKVLNKQNSNKKRTVYLFSREENYFLKFVSYCLLQYDYLFADNLCSFRKCTDVKSALRKLINQNGIDYKYSYKVDVSDYFNSVNTEILLPILKEALKNDEHLYSFVKMLLESPFAKKDGKLITAKKGIMAGVPIAAFLANLYLKELDEYFSECGVLYVRYSDDIMVFADTKEELDGYVVVIKNILAKYALSINSKKEVYTSPGETWEFLGFSYVNGKVDISSVALDKLKKKLKRKAKALVRWKEKNNATNERAIKAYIKRFNRKFFENSNGNETTWSYWYFPVINTDKSLHVIDRYMQDCIRYIANGNYSKSRFNLRYEEMKRLGYISLVNRYYDFLENGKK